MTPLNIRTLFAPDYSLHINEVSKSPSKEELALDIQNLSKAQSIIFDIPNQSSDPSPQILTQFKEKCSLLERILTFLGFNTTLAKVQNAFLEINWPHKKVTTLESYHFSDLVDKDWFEEAMSYAADHQLPIKVITEKIKDLVHQNKPEKIKALLPFLKGEKFEEYLNEISIFLENDQVELWETLYQISNDENEESIEYIFGRLAKTYIETGNSKKAIELYNSHLGEDKWFICLYSVGINLIEFNLKSQAVEIITKWVIPENLTLDKENAFIFYLLARAIITEKDDNGPIHKLCSQTSPQVQSLLNILIMGTRKNWTMSKL